MFTGLTEEKGILQAIRPGAHSAVLTIGCKKILDDLAIGDSVSVNGVCLTATTLTGTGFTADVMHETLNRSSLGSLRTGSSVNLERAMAMGRRFGGHIVSGHIDGTGRIGSVTQDDNAFLYRILCGPDLLRYIVPKGSIAIDGISLTVVSVDEESFTVSIIPHTRAETTLSQKKAGDIVNLENDVIAKYTEKLLAGGVTESPYLTAQQHPQKEKLGSGITQAMLIENGF